MSLTPGRLIPLHAGGAAENMSIDQALLESVAISCVPVLRLYTWSEPTLSLGYFQKLADRDSHLESSSIQCVRRATGGGAIVHHHELTYSIALPVANSHAGPRMDLYRSTHIAASRMLAEFGCRGVRFGLTGQSPASVTGRCFLCFQRRTDEDLIVSGYKVLGSAQRKTRGAVLQHGSLLIRASSFAPQLPGVFDLTSRAFSVEQASESLAEMLSQSLSIQWTPDAIHASERSRARQVLDDKFGSSGWLARR